jgi:two-component system, chemotaxis family, protein-glutamate methylesterase/glutaminase
MDKPIRILVIDDSAFNRQTITAMLEGAPGFSVVGRAGDGEEGLKLAFQLQPDVITLDLEMPKMDGFAFLRLLMARQPTPVIVISGYATRENVFKALELGALDFVAKPSRTITPELRTIKEELLAKVRLVTQLRMVNLADRAARTRSAGTMSGAFPAVAPPVSPPVSRKDGVAPPRLIAIGASTGGPPAINRILVSLEPTLPVGIIITQHMPAKFTKAFAERLDRTTPWSVREAETGDAVTAGCVLVAPGGGSLALVRDGQTLRADIVPPQPDDRYVPSVDRMLVSAAAAMGADVCGIVLTGMGGDGGRGVRAIKGAGGKTVAEAPESAVIFGMPQEAISTGAVDEVAPLTNIPDLIARFAQRR